MVGRSGLGRGCLCWLIVDIEIGGMQCFGRVDECFVKGVEEGEV